MEKKSKLINFIKAMIIIVTAVIIVAGLSKILVLKSEDGINQFDALYKQPENSIDVIFLGSSKVYCDISTGVLWDNHGIASFDLGGAEAPAWVSYYQLKEALKTQSPKVIFYEVSVAAMYPTLFQADNWAADNSYGMKWNSNRIDQLRVNSEEDDFYVRLNPFNVMHGRYKDLEENDFVNVRSTADYKGFDPREDTRTYERPDVAAYTDVEPCSEKAEEYIGKIIELGKSRNIPVVLIASPYRVPESEQSIINYIKTIAEKEGAKFIDFNQKYDDIGIDFETDMADFNHLNYNGNYKYSDYFGKLLKSEFDIPDRRGDDRYISWEQDAALQRSERCDLMISKSDDAGEILTLAKDGYIIFAVNNGIGRIIENGEIVEDTDSSIRLTYRSGDDTFLFVEEGEGDAKHYISLFVNDVQYKEDYENILFVYDAVRHEYIRSITY